MNKKPSNEACRKVADAFDKWNANNTKLGAHPATKAAQNELDAALVEYRAECTPLRTLAEVNADKIAIIDAYYARFAPDISFLGWNSITLDEAKALNALCAEPTRQPDMEDATAYTTAYNRNHEGRTRFQVQNNLNTDGTVRGPQYKKLDVVTWRNSVADLIDQLRPLLTHAQLGELSVKTSYWSSVKVTPSVTSSQLAAEEVAEAYSAMLGTAPLNMDTCLGRAVNKWRYAKNKEF